MKIALKQDCGVVLNTWDISAFYALLHYLEEKENQSVGNFQLQYHLSAAAAAKPLQSCPTLCDPIDGSPPGSPIPGILQARTLEWVAISFSNAWKWKVKVKSLSRVRLLAIPWTAAYQAPPSMGFSRQEYWSGVLWTFPNWRYRPMQLDKESQDRHKNWKNIYIIEKKIKYN